MNGEPVLIVMAAGMASRYGGLKQIEKMTEEGDIILDFSLYDAKKAGFRDAILVIKEEHRESFRSLVDERAGRCMGVSYAYQSMEDIPEGFTVPEDRIKPWGTGHAIYACRHQISGPFAVINADDYYGPQGFRDIYSFLKNQPDHTEDGKINLCMAGYKLGNTVSENGYVTRGLCRMNDENILTEIREQKGIILRDGEILCEADKGQEQMTLPEETVVSMNFWGFPFGMTEYIDEGLNRFLQTQEERDPLTGEYLLPILVGDMIAGGEASVTVLPCGEQWCGVTYREDRDSVRDQLAKMKEAGVYPRKLWEPAE